MPAALSLWKASDADRGKALEVQARNAAALESAYARGLAVLGYQRTERGDGKFQLGIWNEDHSY